MVCIETARLRLRDFQTSDLDDYHARIYSDAEVMRYLPGGQPRPRERTQAALDFCREHGQQYEFSLGTVEERSSRRFMGHAGLVALQGTPDVELAYAFGQAYWGQGCATEAARVCLRYGFETARLTHILALAFPPNTASQRVMQKIGMVYQGSTDRYHQAELTLYRLERAAFSPDDSAYSLLEA